jgi:hypothetical protein
MNGFQQFNCDQALDRVLDYRLSQPCHQCKGLCRVWPTILADQVPTRLGPGCYLQQGGPYPEMCGAVRMADQRDIAIGAQVVG